jgi:hypothetical protein
MNKQAFLTTSTPLPKSWTEFDISSPVIASTTKANMSNHVVMLQGKEVTNINGHRELLVYIDPVSLERKLAIIKITAQLDGQVVTSTTTSL